MFETVSCFSEDLVKKHTGVVRANAAAKVWQKLPQAVGATSCSTANFDMDQLASPPLFTAIQYTF